MLPPSRPSRENMLKNILDNEPVAIAAAVRAVLHSLVLLGIVVLDESALAGISLAIELVLSLFLRNAVNSNATVQKVAAEAFEAGRESA